MYINWEANRFFSAKCPIFKVIQYKNDVEKSHHLARVRSGSLQTTDSEYSDTHGQVQD